MTSALQARNAGALRRAAVRASLAPSVYNTQPWSLHLRDGHLDLYADRRRQLTILDPSGRQLTISCGAALFNARLSLAAAGLQGQIDRFPNARSHDLLARVTVHDDRGSDTDLGVSLASPADLRVLDEFVDTRHTNRDVFTSDQVPDEVIAVLGHAVRAEQGRFFVVQTAQHRAAITALTERAQSDLLTDPSYRAEARSWGRDEAGRLQDRQGTFGSWHKRHSVLVDRRCLVVIGSSDDSAVGWLRAGEALQRMLVETTRQGYVAGPVTQTIVAAADRARLVDDLGLTMTPQLVVRLGRAPASPASRRRRLVDLLVEDA